MSFRRGRCWTYVRAGNFIQAPFVSATQSAFKQLLSAPFPLEYTHQKAPIFASVRIYGRS